MALGLLWRTCACVRIRVVVERRQHGCECECRLEHRGVILRGADRAREGRADAFVVAARGAFADL